MISVPAHWGSPKTELARFMGNGPQRVIYLRYDIALRAMIYAFGIWRNGYYIMLAAGKYIIRQRRISYCASDISLKSAAKRDIICSINKNLTEKVNIWSIYLLY